MHKNGSRKRRWEKKRSPKTKTKMIVPEMFSKKAKYVKISKKWLKEIKEMFPEN